MRILQVLPSVRREFAGPVHATVVTLDAVHRADPSVEFVLLSTGRGLTPAWEEKVRHALPPGCTLELFPAVGRGAGLFSPALVAQVRRTAEAFDLAVLHTLFNPLSAVCARAARRHSVPYVVVPHGTLSRYTFEHRRPFLKQLWWRIVDRGTVAGAEHVRFTALGEAREAARLGFRTPGRTVPHPFASDAPFMPAEERDEATVLFLSRFHPKKGLDLLLPAFARVRDRWPEAQLVVAGSGPSGREEALRDWICEAGLEGAVTLPGFVEGERKRALLGRATVFALPSRHENFGVAVAEAMHAGLPVVTTRAVDIWPDIEEYGAGSLVDPEPPAIADALERLLDDPGLRARMGRAGRRLVEEQYAPDVVGPQILEMYRKAAGARSAS